MTTTTMMMTGDPDKSASWPASQSAASSEVMEQQALSAAGRWLVALLLPLILIFLLLLHLFLLRLTQSTTRKERWGERERENSRRTVKAEKH